MESKITVTERLRREGRWEDATAWRDQERKRLRAEGMNRRQANEKSWELMAKSYTPLADDEIDWHSANALQAQAHFPIECAHVDHEAEPAMSDVWWIYCNVLALDDRLKKNDAEGAQFLIHKMSTTAPTPAAERLAFLAAACPARFLDQVVKKFEAAIERLLQDETVDSHYAAELHVNILHIQEIRAGLEARTESLEGSDFIGRSACVPVTRAAGKTRGSTT